MKNIVIIAHTPSPNTLLLAQATKSGAEQYETDIVSTKLISPWDATAEDVLSADGIIFGTTENLGYMSGALKDFFDRHFYDLLDKTNGMPFGFYVRAGLDGTGTIRAIESIVQNGLQWKPICDPVLCKGAWDPIFLTSTQELGMLMAAGLDAAIF